MIERALELSYPNMMFSADRDEPGDDAVAQLPVQAPDVSSRMRWTRTYIFFRFARRYSGGMPDMVETKIVREISDLAGTGGVNIASPCAQRIINSVGIALLRWNFVRHTAAMPCRCDTHRAVTGVLV